MDREYYLGLDIGTDSVGWSVANTDYTIPKFHGNAMWGIRLFDESNTAEERRAFRTSRRRTQRNKERLEYLEMLFNKEISRVDIAFFQRLKESSLYIEDKSVSGKYSVFNDADFTDKDYHKLYPTVYHLRKDLICDKSPKDIRLVFIALHHIIKNRGHFLFDSVEADGLNDFETVYDNLYKYLADNYEIVLNCADSAEFEKVIKDKSISKTQKNSKIFELFGLGKKDQAAYILSLISGSSVKLCDIFNDESLKNVEKKNITLSGNFDDNVADYEAILGERFELIELLKAIYDWAILADILNGEKYISFAKVNVYEKHKNDLAMLKRYVRKYFPNDVYNEIFKISKEKLNNYVAYSGHAKKNGKTGVLNETCTQAELCEYLKKKLGVCKSEDYSAMFSEIENGTFMPKQVNKDNSVIPMQIHKAELIAILDNAREYLPFLNEKDENGITVYEKIISIFEYRIPYYVGPLNKHSEKSWVVRKEGKIYPWNIQNIVDFDKSAEAFIENLTSKCTYLPNCDVIPKNSILYSKYMVLNELNNLRIDGEKINVALKQRIYTDLFEKHIKITMKSLQNYLKSIGIDFADISGMDGDFKSSLKPILNLSKYDLTEDEKEQIIKAITIFGDDKKLLKKRVKECFGDKLSENEIKEICKLKFAGWSNLSKEFLTEVECVFKPTGEVMNVITALWETNNNLTQLLYSKNFADVNDEKKTFIDVVKSRYTVDTEKSLSDIVNELYVSPKVKRPIYQSILIAKEIEKIKKCPPMKIFVEVARGEEKKERKASRKQRLLDLYKTCKKEYDDLYASLDEKSEDDLRSDKLYLYYTQFGRCMYSGEVIDLDRLLGQNSNYDIDHIYPQSKIKDDSLDNRVLVNKVFNEKKGNIYPISSDIQTKMAPFWTVLKDKGFISKEKFRRLTRKIPLTDDELSSFIARQLVETRQSTKVVAQILEQLYPETEIVYVKAGLVSEFRHKYDLLKCREVNDYHHAKDAYLNIVVGNVYNVRCTHNKANFIKGLQTSAYSMNKMFDFNVKGAWIKDNDESLKTVKNVMSKNNIRYTRYAFEQHGGLFDQNPVKKGSGQVPIKSSGAVSQMEKYGAYNRPASKYFSLIRYADKKGKTVTQLVPIDAYCESLYLANPDEFVSKIVGFDAKVIIPKIKYNACLSFNGYRMHLSRKMSGGATLGYKPAVQLVLSYNEEKYFRNIVKYLTQYSHRKVNRFDGITEQENIALYKALCKKMTETVMAVKFGDLGKKLTEKIPLFESLETEKQAYVIAEIVKILHANVVSGDLTYIGESKNSGIATTNSKISEIKNITSVKLVNQSVTGLFENEVELLK